MTDQPNGLQVVADRYGVSLDAVRHLIHALEAGHGTMAQFNHPDLGGFGQWSSGGMTMIGDMFNHALKVRVDSLCSELSRALPAQGWSDAKSEGGWWPAEFGRPSTSGSQNSMRYAYFPDSRRLAVDLNGTVSIYDTAGYDISGVSQQQGGSQTLRFSGGRGFVDLEMLRRIEGPAPGAGLDPRPFEPEPFTPSHPPDTEPTRWDASPVHESDILATIERMADLQRKGILTDAEFASKKAELLARL